jgi:hypothetical protein
LRRWRRISATGTTPAVRRIPPSPAGLTIKPAGNTALRGRMCPSQIHLSKSPHSQRHAARRLHFSGCRARPFPFFRLPRNEGMERREAPGTSDVGALRTMTRSAARLARHAHPNDVGVRLLPALHRGRRGQGHVLPGRQAPPCCVKTRRPARNQRSSACAISPPWPSAARRSWKCRRQNAHDCRC